MSILPILTDPGQSSVQVQALAKTDLLLQGLYFAMSDFYCEGLAHYYGT